MPKIILVMGLSGSGKTTLATKLSSRLKAIHLNADVIRKQYDDWDFSKEGRIRQATRLKDLANKSDNDYVVIDFICPLKEGRDIIDSDYVIWMDTVTSSKYKDTDVVFEKPSESVVHKVQNLKYNVDKVILEIQGL
jgi:adenylylsulfate kinase